MASWASLDGVAEAHLLREPGRALAAEQVAEGLQAAVALLQRLDGELLHPDLRRRELLLALVETGDGGVELGLALHQLGLHLLVARLGGGELAAGRAEVRLGGVELALGRPQRRDGAGELLARLVVGLLGALRSGR